MQGRASQGKSNVMGETELTLVSAWQFVRSSHQVENCSFLVDNDG